MSWYLPRGFEIPPARLGSLVEPVALLVSVLLASVIGALVGAAAGLVPGLHINNLAYLIAGSSAALSGALVALVAWLGAAGPEGPLLVASVMVSSLIAHTFTSLLPSVFLGAPDPARALSVLPAHRMLLEGRGLEAVRCSLTGCAGGLAASLLALPIFRLLMGDPVEAYERLRPCLALILILIAVILIVSEPPSPAARQARAPALKNASSGRYGPAEPAHRCALVLERVASASLALSGGREWLEKGGVVDVRPWAVPAHIGGMVRLAGVVSEVKRINGGVSFVVEEGGAVEVLVPEGRESLADGLRVGEIVIVEGRVARALEGGWGIGRRLLAAAVFLASGFLGLVVLGGGRVGSRNWYLLGAPPIPEGVMLFPLLCGLFGLPALLLGALDAPATPPQRTLETPLPLRRKLLAILTGTLAGGLIGWYPGMTSAHGSVIARLMTGGEGCGRGEMGDGGGPSIDGRHAGNERNGSNNGGKGYGFVGVGEEGAGKGKEAGRGRSREGSLHRGDDAREFLISLSAVSVANAFFNIVALFVILRARSGALHLTRMVLEGSLEPWWPAGSVPRAFALLVFSAAVAAALALPLTLIVGRALARVYERVPYRTLQLCVVALLVALMLIFSGSAGLAVAAVALCLGLIPPLAGVRRVHLMGAILLPVILFFLGADAGVMSFLGL